MLYGNLEGRAPSWPQMRRADGRDRSASLQQRHLVAAAGGAGRAGRQPI